MKLLPDSRFALRLTYDLMMHRTVAITGSALIRRLGGSRFTIAKAEHGT